MDRYFPFEKIESVLRPISEKFEIDTIGYSENERPIYILKLGSGKKKVLVWSLMHGNESTTTKSIFDLINFFDTERNIAQVKHILSQCTISFIPMLNPDGASMYSRFNANNVDLNRDAQSQTQAETKCFFDLLNNFKPDFCLNMHGQRTIFGTGKIDKPATMSFLAPAFDKDLNINESRKTAMQLIAGAEKELQNIIPHQIGRYDDTYNLNCFGDYIQTLGIPTILFEAGHYNNDYRRNETRKFVSIAILKIIDMIAKNTSYYYKIENYFKIPYNKQNFIDIIIFNSKNQNENCLGIQYKDVLINNQIVFKPYIIFENAQNMYAHRYIDTKGSKILVNQKETFGVDTFIKTLSIGDNVINLDPLN